MEVNSNGGHDFAAPASKFKTAGRGGALVRKATTKAIRYELQPTARDVSQQCLRCSRVAFVAAEAAAGIIF